MGSFSLEIKFDSFIPKGYRVGSFLLDPGDRLEGKVKPGDPFAGKIGIYVDAPTTVMIELDGEPKGDFEIRIETVETGRRYNVVATSRAGLTAGKHSQSVKLRTTLQEQDVLELGFDVIVGARAPEKPRK